MLKPALIKGELPSAREGYGTVFRLAWPATLESLFVAIIGFVDTIMVSALGPEAITAVGICTQPKFLLMAAVISLNIGVTAIVARRKGEGDTEGATRSLKQSLLICVCLCILMTTAALTLARPLLTLAGAGADYIDTACDYFRIVMCGQFFACMGLTMNAAQRGFGNTKISMRANVSANIVNILFNYLLINGVWIFPRLGVRGAAIATALSGFVAFCISLISLLHTSGHASPHNPPSLTLLSGGSWRFDKRTVNAITKVGSSSLVEQLLLRFGFFTFNMICANLGTIPYATHQICINITHIYFSFSEGMGIAATSLVGQNLGARRPDLSMMYGKMCQRVAMAVALCIAVTIAVFRYDVIGLFSDDARILTLGSNIVLIIVVMAMFQASQVVMFGCLRGAGDARHLMLVSLISVGIIRPGLSYILCYPLGLGLIGAWLGMMVEQITRQTLASVRFYRNKWSKIEL